MYLAKLDTTNFEFLAVSQDEEGAIELLKKAWNRHAEEYGATYDWEFVSHSVSVFCTRSGDVWRDGNLMHSYDSAECWTN